ncbi:sensor histidine kinase [Pedobacter gandavensis]|uniref:sensor histidine kinase n=1 Tax=Pedobacter gandavensis TaxID=2679963 RepID=UPI0029302E51|nr:histidine kinase [Pedobacter gandavensis]
MEDLKINNPAKKPISARLYLHGIFISFIMCSWPIYFLVYSRKMNFEWAEAYSALTFFFYSFLALCIYFMVFVVLRNRPALKKSSRILIKVGGTLALAFLYICIRWAIEQHLAYWALGIRTYPREITFSYFFYDNLFNAFLLVFCGLFVKFMDDWYITDRIRTDLEKQNLRLELDFLKSQVNPHFLFNTLNNIQSYIVQDEKMKSIELIGRLSEFMRFALYECTEEYIDLDKEINMLTDYVELERVRCDDRVMIIFETSGNFGHHKVPPLLLMPFVENAFKHGADDQLSNSWIKINISVQEDLLKLQVDNNFSASSIPAEKTGGIGLQNVRKRLNHYFPDKHDLQISNKGNTFHVNLNLQLN